MWPNLWVECREIQNKATNWVPSSILDSCISLKSVMHSDENICPQTVPVPRLANSFLRAKLKENRELWGAHNAKDIYPYIFLKSKYGAIVLIILSQIYHATRWIFWKWGMLLIYFAQFYLGHIQSRDAFRPATWTKICLWTTDKTIFTVFLLVNWV